MKIINLTPRALNFIVGDHTITLPPSGGVARCKTERAQIGSVALSDEAIIPINREFGQVDGLPAPEDGTIFVVSIVVAQAVPERPDVFIIDDVVRGADGQIIGARALVRV